MRASTLLTAASVVATGICAAWPFRQPGGKLLTPPPASVPLDLTLRALDVPLTARAASDQSPAVALSPAARGVGAISIASGSLPLEQFTAPPELPLAFRSQTDSLFPLAPRASGTAGGSVLNERSSQPRTYVLRDGDTLEKLAERFLGSRARAVDLYEANRQFLAGPDLLPVGVTIMIPHESATNKSAKVAER